MKILIVSNQYPPDFLGGFEVFCADVARELSRRGHRVTVLTSRSSKVKRAEPGVVRDFRLHLLNRWSDRHWGSEVAKALWNLFALERALRRVRPDVVYVFSTHGIGGLAVHRLRSLRRPAVVNQISDLWPLIVYPNDAWFGRRDDFPWSRPKLGLLKKAAVRLLVLFLPRRGEARLANPVFASRFMRERYREAGYPVDRAPVIYHGLAERGGEAEAPREGIVFCGRLCPEKGPHVLLEALARLPELPPGWDKVTIIGAPPSDPLYRNYLASLWSSLSPRFRVSFTGLLPREEVFRAYRSHRLLVFPVTWDEPYGLVPLEGMGSGIPVVATATGGLAEYLADGENCLLFPRGDAEALAAAIARVAGDPELAGRLVRGGLRTAERFRMEESVGATEKALEAALKGAGA